MVNHGLFASQVQLYATRPLECFSKNITQASPYVIQLDQSTNFIYAYTAPGGDQNFVYHEANYGSFECTLYADGTVCGQLP